MDPITLLFTAIGLSMDAFAVAICAGLAMKKVTVKNAAVVGLYFGAFQVAMPFIGYHVAALFADQISSFDHWLAFVLLGFLGVRMILESFEPAEGCQDRECPEEGCSDRACPGGKQPERVNTSLRPSEMLPLAIATSIDALAAGFSFAFLDVAIVPAVSFIGIITFALSMLGVKIGSVFGTKFKSKAELGGGVILILIGVKILIEHLHLLS